MSKVDAQLSIQYFYNKLVVVAGKLWIRECWFINNDQCWYFAVTQEEHSAERRNSNSDALYFSGLI
jgi:hypothetical protein